MWSIIQHLYHLNELKECQGVTCDAVIHIDEFHVQHMGPRLIRNSRAKFSIHALNQSFIIFMRNNVTNTHTTH